VILYMAGDASQLLRWVPVKNYQVICSFSSCFQLYRCRSTSSKCLFFVFWFRCFPKLCYTGFFNVFSNTFHPCGEELYAVFSLFLNLSM